MSRQHALCVTLPARGALEAQWDVSADDGLLWRLGLYRADGPPGAATQLCEDVEQPVAPPPAGAGDAQRLLGRSLGSDDGGALTLAGGGAAGAAPVTVAFPFHAGPGDAACRVALRLQLVAAGTILAEGTAVVRAGGPPPHAAAAPRQTALAAWATTAVPVALSSSQQPDAADAAPAEPHSSVQLSLSVTWVPFAAYLPSTPPSTLPVVPGASLSLDALALCAPPSSRRRSVLVSVGGLLHAQRAAAASAPPTATRPAMSGARPEQHLCSFTVAVALCRGSGELLSPPQVVGAAALGEQQQGAPDESGGAARWACDWRYSARVELPAHVLGSEDEDGSFDPDAHLLFYVLTSPPPPPGQAAGERGGTAASSAQQQQQQQLPVVSAFAYLRLFDDPPSRQLAPTAAAAAALPSRPPLFLADRRHDHGAHGTEIDEAHRAPPSSLHQHAQAAALASAGGGEDAPLVISASLRIHTGSPPFLPAATSVSLGGGGGATSGFLASSSGMAVSAPMFAASLAARAPSTDTLRASPAVFPVPPHLQMVAAAPAPAPAPVGARHAHRPLQPQPQPHPVADAQASGMFPSGLRVSVRVVAAEPDVMTAQGSDPGCTGPWLSLLRAIDADDAVDAAPPPTHDSGAPGGGGSSVARVVLAHATAALSSLGAAAGAGNAAAAASLTVLARYRSLTGPALVGGDAAAVAAAAAPYAAMSLLRVGGGGSSAHSGGLPEPQHSSGSGSSFPPSVGDVLKQHQPVLAALVRHYTGSLAALARGGGSTDGGGGGDDGTARLYQAALVEPPPPMVVAAVTAVLASGSAGTAATSLPLAHTLPLAACLSSICDVMAVLAAAQVELLGSAGGGGGSLGWTHRRHDGSDGEPLLMDGDESGMGAGAGAGRATRARASFARASLPQLAADMDMGLWGALLDGAAFVPGLLTPGITSALLTTCECMAGGALRAFVAATHVERGSSASSQAAAAAATDAAGRAICHWMQRWVALLILACVHVAGSGEWLGVWAALPPLEEDELGASPDASTAAYPFASDPACHLRRSVLAFLGHVAVCLSTLRCAAAGGKSSSQPAPADVAAAGAHAALASSLMAPLGAGCVAVLPTLLRAAAACDILPRGAAAAGAEAAAAPAEDDDTEAQLTSLLLSLCLPPAACEAGGGNGGSGGGGEPASGDESHQHLHGQLMPVLARLQVGGSGGGGGPPDSAGLSAAFGTLSVAGEPTPAPGSSPVIAKYRPTSLYSKRTGVPMPLPSVVAASSALAATLGSPLGAASGAYALGGAGGGPSGAASSRHAAQPTTRGSNSYPPLLSALLSCPPPRVRLRAAKSAGAQHPLHAANAAWMAGAIAAEAASLLLRMAAAAAATASPPSAAVTEAPHGQRLCAVYSGGLTLALLSAAAERTAAASTTPPPPVSGLPLAAAHALSLLPRVAASVSPLVGVAVLAPLVRLTAASLVALLRHGVDSWDTPLLLRTAAKMGGWVSSPAGGDSPSGGSAVRSQQLALSQLPPALVAALLTESAEALAATRSLPQAPLLQRVEDQPHAPCSSPSPSCSVTALTALERQLCELEATGDSARLGASDLIAALPRALPLALFLHAQSRRHSGFFSGGSAAARQLHGGAGEPEDDDDGLLESGGGGGSGGGSPGGGLESVAEASAATLVAIAAAAAGTALQHATEAAAARSGAGAGDHNDDAAAAPAPAPGAQEAAAADLEVLVASLAQQQQPAATRRSATRTVLGRAVVSLAAFVNSPNPAPAALGASASLAFLRCLAALLLQATGAVGGGGGGKLPAALSGALASVVLGMLLSQQQPIDDAATAAAAAAASVLASLLRAEVVAAQSGGGGGELQQQHMGPCEGLLARAVLQSLAPVAAARAVAADATSTAALQPLLVQRAQALLAAVQTLASTLRAPSASASAAGDAGSSGAVVARLGQLSDAAATVVNAPASVGGAASALPQACRSLLSLCGYVSRVDGDSDGSLAAVALGLWRLTAAGHGWRVATAFQLGGGGPSAQGPQPIYCDHELAGRALLAASQLTVALLEDGAASASSATASAVLAALASTDGAPQPLPSAAGMLAAVEVTAAGAYLCALRAGEWRVAESAAHFMQATYAAIAASSSVSAFAATAPALRPRVDWAWWERPQGLSSYSGSSAPSLSRLAAALTQHTLQARLYALSAGAHLAREVAQGRSAALAEAAEAAAAAAAASDGGAEPAEPADVEPTTVALPEEVAGAVQQLDAAAAAAAASGAGAHDDGAGPMGQAVRCAATLCASGVVIPCPLGAAYALVGGTGVACLGGGGGRSSAWAWGVMKLPAGASLASAADWLRSSCLPAADAAAAVHGPGVPVIALDTRTVTTTLQAVPVPPSPFSFYPPYGSAAGGRGASQPQQPQPQFTMVPVESFSSALSLLGTGAAAAAALAGTGGAPPPALHVWPLTRVPDSESPDGGEVGGALRLRAWVVRSATATREVGRPGAAACGGPTRITALHAVSASGVALLLGGKYELEAHGDPDGLLDGSGGDDGEEEEDDDDDEEEDEEGADGEREARRGDPDARRRARAEAAAAASPLLQVDVVLPGACRDADTLAGSGVPGDEASRMWAGLPSSDAGGAGPVLPPTGGWVTRVTPLPPAPGSSAAACTATVTPVPLAVGAAQALAWSGQSCLEAMAGLVAAAWAVDGLQPPQQPTEAAGTGGRRRQQQQSEHAGSRQRGSGANREPTFEDDVALLTAGPQLRFDTGGPIVAPPAVAAATERGGGGGGTGTASGGLEAAQASLVSSEEAYTLALQLGLPPFASAASPLAASLLPGPPVATAAAAAAGDAPQLEHDATALCARLAGAAEGTGLLEPRRSPYEPPRVPLEDAASVGLALLLGEDGGALATGGGGALAACGLPTPGPLLPPAAGARLLAALSPAAASPATQELLQAARGALVDYGELKAVWREKRVTALRRAWIREDEALAAAGYDTSANEVPNFAAMMPRRPSPAAAALDAAANVALLAVGAAADAIQRVPGGAADPAVGAAFVATAAAFNAVFEGWDVADF